MPDENIPTYLPGCYRHLRPYRDESLPGFLLRLAEQNGYTGISEFIGSTFVGLNGKSLQPWLVEIRQSLELLARLGRIACGDPGSLIDFHARQSSLGTWLYQGCRIPSHGFTAGSTAICPECLSSDGYAREEWELSPVTVCPTHRRQLISCCSRCGQDITWRRGSVAHCGSCGALLSEPSQAIKGTTESEVQLAENFSALADFRVELEHDEVAIISWEEMLNIARALSQPPLAWIGQELKQLQDFSRLPISNRRTVLNQLSLCRANSGRYVLPLLRPVIRQKLSAICLFSPEDYLTETAFAFLMRCEQLSSVVARVLAGPPESMVEINGAALFDGRPPSLSSQEEVSKFVGIDWEAYRYLRRHNYIPYHDSEEDLGLDIDCLLRAKHYLEHRLAGLDEIGKMIGLPVKWEELNLFPISMSRPASLGSEKRVPFDDLRAIQLTLLEKISNMSPPSKPISLIAIASRNEQAMVGLAALIANLINGRISNCRWSAPYKWVDIEIDEEYER